MFSKKNYWNRANLFSDRSHLDVKAFHEIPDFSKLRPLIKFSQRTCRAFVKFSHCTREIFNEPKGSGKRKLDFLLLSNKKHPWGFCESLGFCCKNEALIFHTSVI